MLLFSFECDIYFNIYIRIYFTTTPFSSSVIAHIVRLFAYLLSPSGALDAPFPSSGGKKETYSVKNRNKKCRDANGNLHPDEIKSREIESQRLYNELQQKRSENKK